MKRVSDKPKRRAGAATALLPIDNGPTLCRSFRALVQPRASFAPQ